MDSVIKMFDELSRQYTVLYFERERIKSVRMRRGSSFESEQEERLTAKIEALNTAIRGLAKLLEL